MILTSGGRFAVYMINLKRVRWEGPELSPGQHTIEFGFQ